MSRVPFRGFIWFAAVDFFRRREMNTMHGMDESFLTPLQRALANLDAALTQKDLRQVLKMAWDQKATAESISGSNAYYLSDGGYSRVAWTENDDDTPRLYLTTQSTDKTRKVWAVCTDLIAEVEAEILVELMD
jgi:hypothetical protein